MFQDLTREELEIGKREGTLRPEIPVRDRVLLYYYYDDDDGFRDGEIYLVVREPSTMRFRNFDTTYIIYQL